MYLNPAMVLRGFASHIPGAYKLSVGWTGGTDSAEYCYSVWLRHLICAWQCGLARLPERVAEIGPGDSLGMGLAALISGVDEYYAFDVVEYFNAAKNLRVFDELVALFRERAPVPSGKDYVNVKPCLGSYDFPSDILTEERLARALDPGRIREIRDAIANVNRSKGRIKIYFSPEWYDHASAGDRPLDMIFSQAVMEHVDHLASGYGAMYRWLKPGGIMTHEIDFKCHGLAVRWNGHWGYSDRAWKLLRGKLPYLINREPHSTHVRLLQQNNFKIVLDAPTESPAGIPRKRLCPRFSGLTDRDLVTSDAFLVAVK